MLRGHELPGCIDPSHRLLDPQHLDDLADTRRLGAARKRYARRLADLRHLPAVFRADLLEQLIQLSSR